MTMFNQIHEPCCPIINQVTTVQPGQLIGTSSELTGARQVDHLQPVNTPASSGQSAKEETAGEPAATIQVEKVIHLCLSLTVCTAYSK